MYEFDNWQKDFEILIRYFRDDITLLFNRFNYFLIAMAFLLGGFVATVAANNFKISIDNDLFWLAISITLIGITVAYGFAVINFLNARFIFELGKYIENFEKDIIKSEAVVTPYYLYALPINQIGIIAKKREYKTLLIFYIICQALAFIGRVSTSEIQQGSISEKRDYTGLAPHTWLIPMFFTLIWTIFFLYLAIHNPLLYGIYSSIGLFCAINVIIMNLVYIGRVKKNRSVRGILTVLLTLLFLWMLNFTFHLFNIWHLSLLGIP